MWAFIYYLRSKITKICETVNILRFSVDEYENDKDHYLKSLFFTRWPSQDPASEPVPIYVLVVEETAEALETRIKQERPKIPKIRHSAQYAKYESSEDEDDASQDTNKQKEQKKVAARKAEEVAIIEAHLKSKRNDPSQQKSYKKTDVKNLEKHISSSKKEPLMSLQSETMSGELERTKSKLHKTNQELEEILEKLEKANNDIKSLETENSILKKSQTTKPLTENSPVIVQILEKIKEMQLLL